MTEDEYEEAQVTIEREYEVAEREYEPMLPGVVTRFSTSTVTGTIVMDDGRELDFPSTAFAAKRTPRFPFVGERVEVLIQDGRVLGVVGLG